MRVTSTDIPSGATLHGASGLSPDAGAMLRDARETAGLTIDMVSQQLKLAPRQVRALEDGDYGLLPGRTFVRGFARNYARLLGLDADAVLDALPGAGGEAALESPTLHATAVNIGELPSSARGQPARVALAAVVVLAVVGGAVYAYRHYQGDRPTSAAAPRPPAVQQSAPTAPAAAMPPASEAAPPGVTLPNPVVSPPVDSGATPERSKSSALGGLRQVNARTSTDAAIAPLSLVTRGGSWIEVRDGSGQPVLATTVAAGQSQALVGAPPFDVVIGNAPEVTLSYRGQPVDLAPYTRQNVARLRLE